MILNFQLHMKICTFIILLKRIFIVKLIILLGLLIFVKIEFLDSNFYQNIYFIYIIRGTIMKIDWKGIFSRTPEALNKLVSIGLSVEEYKAQRDKQRCIWEGYNRFGMYGMNYAANNYWDSSDIVNDGIMRMQNLANQVISDMYNGNTGAVGGSSGNIGSTHNQPITLTPDDEKQGVNLMVGHDTKFMNIEDWTTLNNKSTRTETEQTSWKNMYTNGLKKLANAFAKNLDINKDGKITKDEFTKYFKSVINNYKLYSNCQEEDIDELAKKAWENIYFNLNDNSSLDEEEVMALLAYLDKEGGLDGKIKAADISNGLRRIANDKNIDLKDEYNKILQGNKETEEPQPEEEIDDNNGAGV